MRANVAGSTTEKDVQIFTTRVTEVDCDSSKALAETLSLVILARLMILTPEATSYLCEKISKELDLYWSTPPSQEILVARLGPLKIWDSPIWF